MAIPPELVSRFMRKTIVHAWAQEVKNLEQTPLLNRWGLGDCLRGSANLFEVSRELDFDFAIDIGHHPVSSILAVSPETPHNKTNATVDFYSFESYSKLCLFTNDYLSRNPALRLMSNGYGFWGERYKADFQKFIKPRLELLPELKRKAATVLPEPKSYRVFHFRLGDIELVEKKATAKKELVNMISDTSTRQKSACAAPI